jgi:membrane fusion protein (multidrug efflux system)
LLATIAGCGQDDERAAAPPPPGVLVAKVQNRAISETVEYVGRTVAVNDVSLRAQVEGYLLERRFAEGDDITQGTELFLIDPELYQAGVAAAEGEVAQAEAALARANKDLARYQTLIKKQNVSQQQLDEAQSDKFQAEANLKSAQAKLQKAELDLAHTVISAPFDGRIGRSSVSVGDLITPQSEELARLVELDPIYANFSVSEGDVIAAKRKIRRAGGSQNGLSRLEVTLRLPDGSTYAQMGRLDFIDNVVDRKTGTVVLRARFANPDKLLVPGLYVSTVLGREETQDKLVIPQAAVQEDQAGTFVMVVGPDATAEQRRIETGDAVAGELVVNAGLEPDERVIVEGIQKVRPGQVVDAKLAPRPTTQSRDRKERRGGTSDDGSAGSGAEDARPRARIGDAGTASAPQAPEQTADSEER